MQRHDCTCPDTELCASCFGRALLAALGQAAVIGQCWAERVCRGELRARDAWPEHDERTLAIARRKVASLTRDPRMIEELARACSSAAAAWWERRGERYR